MKTITTFEKKKRFLLGNEYYFLIRVSQHFKFTTEQLRRYKTILIWRNVVCNESIDWNTEILDEFKDLIFVQDDILPEINCNESLPWSIEFINRYKELWSWEMLVGNPVVMEIPGIKEYYAKEFLPYKYDNPWVFNSISNSKKEYNPQSDNSGLDTDSWDWDVPAEWRYESMEEIKKAKNVRWFQLSRNTRIPWSTELIKEHEDEWEWEELSQNPQIPWNLELIRKYEDKIYWSKHDKCEEKGTPVGMGFSANLGVQWDRQLLSRYIDKLNAIDVSLSPSAKWDIDLLIQFEDFWDYNSLSMNKIVWEKVFSEFDNEETINSLLDIVLAKRNTNLNLV